MQSFFETFSLVKPESNKLAKHLKFFHQDRDEALKGGGGRWSPGAHHFESLEPWSPDDSHGNFLEF